MTPTFTHDHMKLDDHDHQFQLFNEKPQPSSSTISTHVLSNSSIHDQGYSYYPREAHQQKHQREADNLASEGGSSSEDLKLCLWKNDNGQGYQISGLRHHNIPTKWLPSKLRLVRRMMESNQTATNTPANLQNKFEDHDHKQGSSSPMETTENSSNSSSSTPVRVCSDCNTTKTPLWRSGPKGPKSLCNACGIRQRKARRALAAAAAAANGTTLEVEAMTTTKPKVQEKDKRLKINTKISPSKKRSKLSNNNRKKNKLCFEDFLISLSKNLAFHQVFPQDEKEAAILLMALSCGLVHG